MLMGTMRDSNDGLMAAVMVVYHLYQELGSLTEIRLE